MGRSLRSRHSGWSGLSLFWRGESPEDVLCVLCGFSWVREQLGIKPGSRAGLQSFLRCIPSRCRGGSYRREIQLEAGTQSSPSPPLSPQRKRRFQGLTLLVLVVMGGHCPQRVCAAGCLERFVPVQHASPRLISLSGRRI